MHPGLIAPSAFGCAEVHPALGTTENRSLILAFARISSHSFLGCPSLYEKVVGSSGLEPPTSRLSGARSNHLSYEPIVKAAVFRPARPPCGGDEEVRTPDPLRARQVLSQLSYTPIAGVRGLTAASLFAFRFSRFLSDPQNQTTFELRTFPCH